MRTRNSIMKKLVFLFFILPFSFFTCVAQDVLNSPVNNHSTLWSANKDSSRKGHVFLALNAGLSFPGSNFGKTNLNSLFIHPGDSTHALGYAGLGFNLNLSGGFFLTKKFGLLAKISYSHNAFEQAIFNSSNADQQTAYVSSGYNIWQFTAGAFKNFQITSEQSAWVTLMAGCTYANYPQVTISDTLHIFTFVLKNALNASVQLSVGYEIMVFQGIGLLGSLSYSFSELYYSPATYVYSYPAAETYSQSTPVHMNYGAMDLTIGMVFHL